jgi:hypothetical protein
LTRFKSQYETEFMQMNALKNLENDEIDNHTLNDKEKEIER